MHTIQDARTLVMVIQSETACCVSYNLIK
jgi:hypothetical protein